MTSRSTWTRRQIIRTASIGAATTAVAGLAGGSRAAEPARRPARGALGANDRIRVGIIGPGDRGHGLLSDFFEVNSRYNAELVAVCDLWSVHRERGRDTVRKASGKDPALFRNTEELYNANAVDAVIIATPDFSHALLCAEAVRAGMDVYVEKPLADMLEDAREVRKAVLDTGAIVQVGTGRRSEGKYKAAAEFIKSGQFGKVNGVEMFWNNNDPMRWRRPDEVARLKESDTDWGRYQLNRPRRPFDPRRYLEFRLFWPYSSGLPDQWMSHQVDIVPMLTGDPYPKSCVASGGLYQWHDGRENPDTFAAILEYPSGFQVRYTARQTNNYGGEGLELFLSNQGVLDLDKGEVRPDGGIGKKQGGPGEKLSFKKLSTDGDESHMGNWLQCVRERKQPNADIQAGYSHAVAVCMAIRSMQTGRRTIFDPQTHEIREA